MKTEPEKSGGRAAFAPRHWLALFLAALAYAAFVVPQWSRAYIDFGDGNYLYIASRIADGVAVYRDILAPQPPAHLFLGALLVKISRAVGMDSPLYLIRAFSLLLHLASFALVVEIARRAWGRAAHAVLAGVLFLLMPIGLWWSMAWQSEPLEIFFLLCMLYAALRDSPGRNALTGLLGAMAVLTNATAAPFLLVLILYMAQRNPARAAWIALPALAFAGLVTLAMEIYSDGHFLQNVVFNQTGTYPRDGFLPYAVGKILREGRDIFWLEGGFIVLALLGFFRFLRASPLHAEMRHGLACFFLATMCSFLYVTKGGTVDYIYCLAEPALAVLAVGEIEVVVRRVGPWLAGGGANSTARDRIAESLLAVGGLALLALIALGPASNHYLNLWTQRAYELPDLEHAGQTPDGSPAPNVEQVVRWIERYSEPGDVILAPPFYAFLTDRVLWSEYSEIFIWTIKYYNNVREQRIGGEGWNKAIEMAHAIRQQQMKIVIIELDQTGRIPEVMDALASAYRPVTEEPYRTLNTRLGIYVPKDADAP